MNISNHQIIHIITIVIFIIIFIYNNTSKHPLKPVSWNLLCFVFIVQTLIEIYKTHKTETKNLKLLNKQRTN